jgi:hypothetical protein
LDLFATQSLQQGSFELMNAITSDEPGREQKRKAVELWKAEVEGMKYVPLDRSVYEVD